MSKKNVYINFSKPSTITKWEDLSTYMFLTDGNKFLPAVLSYTYTFAASFDDDSKSNYKVKFGPYYDYGCSTNNYDDYGKSTIELSKFDKTTYISEDHVAVPSQSEIVFGVSGPRNVRRLINSPATGKDFGEIINNVGSNDYYNLFDNRIDNSFTHSGPGKITISYSYTIYVPNVETNNNLYVIAGKKIKSTINNEELGLYVSYKYTPSSQTQYTQTGPLTLKPFSVSDTWNPAYGGGSCRIRTNSEWTDQFKNWINDNYIKYVTGPNATNYILHGSTIETASQISQRSRLYQIPANELNGNNSDFNIKLFYNGSYLYEVNPDVKTPTTDNDKDVFNKKITYSYLIDKTTGQVTLDGLAKGSYIYSYTNAINITSSELSTTDPKYWTYTAHLKTINDLGFGDIDDYLDYIKDKSFKKEYTKNGITYVTSYQISTYFTSEEQTVPTLDCYSYSTYTFGYQLHGINATSIALPFTYLMTYKGETPNVEPNFTVYKSNAKTLYLNYDSKINYIYEDEVLDAGEYVKLQFSDNELKNTVDLKLSNQNNQVFVTSHSDLFYLNIVQTKSNFNGFIPKIITTPDINFYQTVLNGTNYGWRIAFVRTNSSSTTSEIYIGVPKTDSDMSNLDSFDNTVTSMYDICIKVTYDIIENTSDNKETKTVSEIKQASDNISKSTIDVPEITANTEYFWTDDIFNMSGHEYKNAFQITTASGVEYFGIRSKRHGQHERNDFRFDSENPVLSQTDEGTYYLGYDLKGMIVSLNTDKRNDYIYSFKNGEQFVKINDGWKQKDLFPSKTSSYEFIVTREDIKPDYYISSVSTQNQQANINCVGINELYKASGQVLDVYSTYSVAVPYTKKTTAETYSIIKNSSEFQKTTDSVYEAEYEDVPENVEQQILNNKYVNLYKQDITYTQLKLNNLSYFKTITSNDCFYKYVKSVGTFKGTYSLYTVKELNKLTSLDGVYERYVIYTEITNSTLNGENGYIQKYNYSIVNKKEQPSGSLYYAHNLNDSQHTYTYIAQGVNIVTDDSIQYYAYTYVQIPSNEISKYKSSDATIYIKEDYRKIESESEFNDYFEKHVDFYICTCENDLPYRIYPINSSQLLDDIDLTGNTIYLKNANDISSTITLNKLKTSVTDQVKIASAGVTSLDEIETRKNLTRRNILKGKTTFAANNVVSSMCVFDFDGKFKDYKDIYENPSKYQFVDGKIHIKGSTDPKDYFYIFVKETGYRSIDKHLIGLGYNQQYYTWRIDKVSHSQIRTLTSKQFKNYVYVDASEFGLTHEFGKENQYSGILRNDIINKSICIAKVNEYGFIEYDGIQYYTRNVVAKPTKDVFMNPNKVYYKHNDSKLDISGITPIIGLTYTYYDDGVHFKTEYDEFNKSNYTLDWNKVRYYNNTKTVYSLSNVPYTYETLPYPLTDNEYIKSSFLYQTYTINDGISKSKGGSYYTNIYVFDKNNGAINKTLYLDQNIINVNTYNYVVTEKYLKKVNNDIVLNNLSPLNYKEYYVSINNGALQQLSETSYSPAYFFNTPGCEIYTYASRESEVEYSCQAIPGAYQYYNSTYNVPITAVVDDNLFGIVAYNFDISKTAKGFSYNLFDLEVVKLYRMSRNNIGLSIQEHSVKEDYFNKSVPFALTNDVEYKETGTYSWHNPKFASHVYNTSDLAYGWKNVEETAGYWTKDYEKNIIPFHVSSYIFYPDTNTISNVSSTYSFIPNSYILSSKVEYPKISYETISSVTEEQIYYSYVLGGIEYHYPSSKNVQVNADGTYTGLVKQHIFSKEKGTFIYATRPIQLSQHKTVVKNSRVTNVVEQEHRIDTKWFAYKTSLALTNESVPVLYNTELMPATTKEIQYWDAETESYQLKTVIASYAYYAYQYMYDTKPFKVSSYLFKASYLTIDNFGDLGSYVENASSSLTNSVKSINTDFNKWTSYYRTAESQKVSSINKAYDLISAYVKDGFIELGESITTLSTNLGNSISNVLENVSYISNKNNEILNETLSTYGYAMTESIDTLNTNIVKGIDEHKDKLSGSIDTLSSYVKNIVLGESIEIPKSMDIVTKDGIVISYNIEMDSNLDSLGELLLRSFITAKSETYTYVDADGLTHITTNYTYTGLGDILKRVEMVPGVPNKQEFVMNLAPKMFANIDFDNEIVDEVKYDENGNITEKKTHKNNPTEMAKKIIYRANILWEELAKAGYCEDTSVTEKQNLLANVKVNGLTSNESLKNNKGVGSLKDKITEFKK